jgi:hypothetical protein
LIVEENDEGVAVCAEVVGVISISILLIRYFETNGLVIGVFPIRMEEYYLR